MAKAALALIALLFGLLLSHGGIAQQVQGQTGASDAAVKSARPLWSELSPKQQAVLAPIAAEWDKLDTTRRKKWVTIANRYPKMTPDEQQRLQSRMQDWANLTSEQRRVARENYQQLKQLPRSQRGELKQKWQDQQSATPAPQDTPEAAATGK